MTKAPILDRIAVELKTAQRAREAGNEGMARVCARRAAGAAISHWLERHPRQGWGADTMGQLRSLEHDESAPPDVREAAARLTAKITQHFTPPFPTDPIADSRVIINHFLR